MANFNNPNFSNPQFNDPQLNDPAFNSQAFNSNRLSTTSPITPLGYQPDRNQHNLSPTSYEAYTASTGRTPLNQPFDVYDNSPFLNHGATPSPRGAPEPAPAFDQPGGRGFADEDEDMLQNADVTWRAVAKPMRLGRATVMCLIFNRMIGMKIQMKCICRARLTL